MARMTPRSSRLGMIASTPSARRNSTFAVKRPPQALPFQKPFSNEVRRNLIGSFNNLSRTLQQRQREQSSEDESYYAEIAKAVSSGRDKGKSDSDIFKSLSESDKSPRRVRSLLNKLYTEENGFTKADNPVFQFTLQSIRGEQAAAELGRIGTDQIQEAAERVAARRPEERAAAANEELLQLRKENEDLFDIEALGIFGVNAAEENLQRVGESYIDEVFKRAAEIQVAEAETAITAKMITAVAPVVQAFATLDGGDDVQAYQSAATALGLVIDQAKIGGVLTSEQSVLQVRKAIGELVTEIGPEKGADFLEYAADNVKNGAGVKVLQDSLELQGYIDSLQAAAAQDGQQKFFRIQQERARVGDAILRSNVWTQMQEAASSGNLATLNSVLTNAEGIIRSGDLEAFEELGLVLSEDDINYALEALQDERARLSRTAAASSEAEMQGFRDTLSDVLWEEGILEARKALDMSLDVNGTQRGELVEFINGFPQDDTIRQAYRTLIQEGGLNARLIKLAERTTPTVDGAEGPSQRHVEKRESELRRELRRELRSNGELMQTILEEGPMAAEELLEDFQERVLKRDGDYFSVNGDAPDDIGKLLGTADTMSAQEEIKALNRLVPQRESAVGPYSNPEILVGGVKADAAPSSIRRLHDFTTRKAKSAEILYQIDPEAERFDLASGSNYVYVPPEEISGPNNPGVGVNRLIKALDRVNRDTTLEDHVKDAAFSESLGFSGMLSSTSQRLLEAGNVESALTHISKSLTDNEDRQTAIQTALLPVLSGRDFDFGEMNPYSIRSSVLQDAARMTKPDKFERPQATEFLTEEAINESKLILQRGGIEPTMHNVLDLLDAQAELWARVNTNR